MKKKSLFFVFVLVILFSPKGIKALTKDEVAGRNTCSNYEVAIAVESRAGDPSSTSLTHVNCYNDYYSALNAMNNNSNRDTILLERKNGNTKIINAKYALVDLTNRGSKINYYYPTASSGSSNAYMVTSSQTGAVEGAFLDFDPNSRRAKVKLAGYTGWVNEDAYNIVPIVWVYSIGYYKSTNNEFKHVFARDITTTSSSSYGIALSKTPEGLSNGKVYFSYDGHYFYTNQYTMIGDYKAGNNNNAANKNNPYYNYYQYLPNHSKTNYSATNINQYIRDGLGYTYTVFGNTLDIKGSFDTDQVSKLYGMGTYFIHGQEQYGANAILSLGLNRNESGDGRSSISVLKNNGFGQGAVDSSPFGSAYGFLTYQGGIYNHAQHFVGDMYENPNHSYYHGGHFGNKSGGWNIKYASDPFWGEKAASYYYRFDRYYGFQDYNFYQLAINTRATQIYSSPNTTSRVIYSINNEEIPVIIEEEVTGTSVDGNNKWYKIVSDKNINSNKDSYGTYAEKFDWENSYAYVPAAYFKKINNAVSGIKSINDVYPHKGNDYRYSFYNDGNTLTPKVGKTNRETLYYYDGALTEATGKKVLGDKYVMVYDRAIDKNGKVVSYLVTSNYKYDQKEWVSVNDITIVGGKYGKQAVDPTGYSSNVFNSAGSGTIISGIYDGAYVPVLEEVTVGGKVYLKVPVSLDSNTNSYGYTLKTDSDARIEIFNDYEVVVNDKPVINATNKTIKEGTTIDLKSLATATDKEDGDLTNKIVVEGTVSINTPGKYTITYKVTDSFNQTTTKQIIIEVIKDLEPVITASDITLKEGTTYNLLTGVSATDNEDGNITNKVTIQTNNVDFNTPGKYQVTYKVSDSCNHTVTKVINVTIVSKDTLIETRVEREGEFYLDGLRYDSNSKKYEVSGYLIIKGINNKVSDDINYQLVLKDKNSDKKYYFDVSRWIKDTPFDVDSQNGFDYTGSWFKGYIDFNKDNLEGDYDLYMKASTETDYTEVLFTNVFNRKISRRAEDSKYGYNFRVNMLSKKREIELNIRKDKLITTGESNTYRNMTNNYDDITFIDNKLNIIGTSYNYGISYKQDNFVERKLILENTTTFKQYTYDVGATKDGSYEVKVSDNIDKTFAWYNSSIDVSNLEKGTYSIIVYTKTKDVSDYGEVVNIFGTVNEATTEINNKKYKVQINLKRNKRIELVVE